MHTILDPSLLPPLLVWSAQVAVLAAAAWLASLAIAHPKGRLAVWQGVLGLALLLPAIEPWKTPAPIPAAVEMTAPDATAMVPVASASAGLHWRDEYWLWLLAAGAAIRTALLFAGILRLRRYRMQARPLPEPPLRFASAVASWYASDSVSSPVTYGWRNPVILLPSHVMEMPAELSEAIQCHELIHVRRGDWLFVLGESAVRGLLWFHPAIWFLTNRIQLAREQVVDREAVGLLRNRDKYLDALLAVASLRVKADPLGSELAPAFLRKRHLVARVKAVAKEVPMSRTRIAAGIAAASSVISVAGLAAMWLFPFTSAQVVEAQTAPDGPGITVDAGAPLIHRTAVRGPQGLTGTIVLQATIDSKGEVTDARVLSGPDELRKAALTSVLQWHYAPGPSTAQVSIQFQSAAPAAAAPGAPSPTAIPRPVVAPPSGPRAAAPTAVLGGPPVPALTTPPPPPPPPPPPAPAFPAQVKSIQFQGLSQEAEQELRARINVHEGDSISVADFTAFSNAVRAFDSHMLPAFTRAESGQIAIQVRVMPESQSVPSGEGQVRMSEAVQTAKIVFAPKPVYPPIAKQARIQGAVLLNVVVAKDGTVRQMNLVSSSNPLLTPAAMDAVKQWVYQPTMLNGEAVEVVTQVTINFTLQ